MNFARVSTYLVHIIKIKLIRFLNARFLFHHFAVSICINFSKIFRNDWKYNASVPSIAFPWTSATKIRCDRYGCHSLQGYLCVLLNMLYTNNIFMIIFSFWQVAQIDTDSWFLYEIKLSLRRAVKEHSSSHVTEIEMKLANFSPIITYVCQLLERRTQIWWVICSCFWCLE